MRHISAKTILHLVCALFVIAAVVWPGSAQAQQLPPPPLNAQSDDNNCGWGLAGAAAALIGGKLTDNQPDAGNNFTGFYAGGHLGCAWADTNWAFQNT